MTRELGARPGCDRRVRDRGVAREVDKRARGVAEEKGWRAGAWHRS